MPNGNIELPLYYGSDRKFTTLYFAIFAIVMMILVAVYATFKLQGLNQILVQTQQIVPFKLNEELAAKYGNITIIRTKEGEEPFPFTVAVWGREGGPGAGETSRLCERLRTREGQTKGSDGGTYNRGAYLSMRVQVGDEESTETIEL